MHPNSESFKKFEIDDAELVELGQRAIECGYCLVPWSVQAANKFVYVLPMMGKNDSRQGSLFLDGERPSVERGSVAGLDRQMSEPHGEARSDHFHMRIQRHPATPRPFRKWWRRLEIGRAHV